MKNIKQTLSGSTIHNYNFLVIFGGIALKLSTCSWFNPCPSFSSVAADDRKQFHCLNIIRNNKNWSITFGIQRKDNKRFASMFVLL